jgi:hypothetical protein
MMVGSAFAEHLPFLSGDAPVAKKKTSLMSAVTEPIMKVGEYIADHMPMALPGRPAKKRSTKKKRAAPKAAKSSKPAKSATMTKKKTAKKKKKK